MEELVDILRQIRDELRDMNSNIEGLYDAVSDVCAKLESVSHDIKGDGLYNTLVDVCDKLDDISSTLGSIELNTTP